MFHVPERGRITDGALASTSDFGNCGAFLIESPTPGWMLLLICGDGSDGPPGTGLEDWDHVSVHARNRSNHVRTPTWREMVHVKNLCWDPEDCVVQFHPRASQYVNVHPHVLHLWRWLRGTFPTPPLEAV